MQTTIGRVSEGGQGTSDHAHPETEQTEGQVSKSLPASAGFPDRKDKYALILLTAAVAIMFWQPLFTSRMLFYRDILNQSYPLARLIHEICRKGFLPYWNPYLNFGQPILENPNSLFFYPTTLLIVLPAGYSRSVLAGAALAAITPRSVFCGAVLCLQRTCPVAGKFL
jgi:hypothetical protein